jgi:hypothetical protein
MEKEVDLIEAPVKKKKASKENRRVSKFSVEKPKLAGKYKEHKVNLRLKL